MRKISVISALVLSVVATIWATLPDYTYAFIPAIIAIILGYVSVRLSKDRVKPKKLGQLAILLSGLSLFLLAYKFIYMPLAVEEISPTEQKIEQSIEEDEISDEESDRIETENDSVNNTIKDQSDTTDSTQKIIKN